MREITIMQQLTALPGNHFTTKLKNLHQIGEEAYLTMDYRKGDLKSLLESSRKGVSISEDHIVVILHNLLSAVQFLHKAGVVHRDLKPANILIDKSCQVRLCDFGMSRVLE